MGLPKLKPKISVRDYLEGEKVSGKRHEYIDGEIFARSGNNLNHNRIVGNLLDNLKRVKCDVYFLAFKVFVSKLNRFYYPDLPAARCGRFVGLD